MPLKSLSTMREHSINTQTAGSCVVAHSLTVVDVSCQVLDAADVILCQCAQRTQCFLLILLCCQLVQDAVVKVFQLRARTRVHVRMCMRSVCACSVGEGCASDTRAPEQVKSLSSLNCTKKTTTVHPQHALESVHLFCTAAFYHVLHITSQSPHLQPRQHRAQQPLRN